MDQAGCLALGGTRNGTIVHWPRGITEPGGVRSQFTHVIDVVPTILEAAGLPEPAMVNGVQQAAIEGTSMLYTLNDADDDTWELYDGSTDYSQAQDLSAELPEMLAKLQRLWLTEAANRCCRWTTGPASGSTPTSPAGRP